MRAAAVDGAPLREVSRAMVRLYKEQFGRGPESVSSAFQRRLRHHHLHPHQLAHTGREDACSRSANTSALRDIRVMFQHATEPQFRAAVEQITGRRVIGFTSGIDVEHDISSELFTLEPRKNAEPPRP